MRVVFLEDVAGVAQGGEVKEVKNGFARNYLIPKNLAVVATQDTLQRVQRLGKQAEDTRLQRLTDMKALGEELDGVQINIAMRAGASGRLYGSVTNVVVAEELGKLTDREINRRTIEIPESIRQVGLHQSLSRLVGFAVLRELGVARRVVAEPFHHPRQRPGQPVAEDESVAGERHRGLHQAGPGPDPH